MSSLAAPVSLYMTESVFSVAPGDLLPEVHQRLEGLSVSSLPVVDEDDHLLGVISRTDLLRVGLQQARRNHQDTLLALPARPVSQWMTERVVRVRPTDSVSLAADQMVRRNMHRVYVELEGKLVGVLSTFDVMHAIRDKRNNHPIEEFMSAPVFSVRADQSIEVATERLAKAHVSGLVVLDDDWPVGVFTQREALSAQNADPRAPVKEVMSHSMLALDASTPLYRAAEQAGAARVRRVIAVRGRARVGILTGLDFARAAI